MKRAFLISIVFCICLNGCKRQLETTNRNNESEKNQDTIINIVERLCGNWDIYEDLKKEYDSKEIGTGTMAILCVVNIDNNQLVNQLYLDRSPGLSNIGAIVPKNLDSLFFPASDSVTVSKKGKHYGLKYHDLGGTNFIPIKELNDSLLILVDGRKFQRKK